MAHAGLWDPEHRPRDGGVAARGRLPVPRSGLVLRDRV